MKDEKIMILGGFGFMGKNLNEIFTSSDYKIYNESRRTNCDITNYTQLKNKIKTINPDIIINAAAHVGSISYVSQYPADVIFDNTLLYLNIYNAVKEINPNIKIINPISNCSYPGIIDIQHENKWWDGEIHNSVESYGTPKKLSYVLSKCYNKQYGIKTINLIIPNAYGPNDYLDEQRTHAMNGIIMRMIKSKNNNNKTFSIWGTGEPIREWVYMLDVARVIKEILDNNLFNLPNPLNIGQQYGISINDSVNIVKQLLDYDVKITHDTTKQDGAPVKILSNQLFKQYFPNFKFINYYEGIHNTIQYYNKLI
jgi:GDP-L-fucose synthase